MSIDDTVVSIFRDKDGVLNIDRQPAQPPTAPDTTPEMTPETTPDEALNNEWQLSLSNFAINHLAVNLLDHGVEPFADVGISDLNVQIRNISNEQGARFPSSLSLQVRTDGTLEMDGNELYNRSR